MTVEQIIQTLMRIHKKYSGDRSVTPDSQMCAIWPIDDPPDVLENTPQLDEIEDALDFGFTEEQAVEFYDMEIDEAAQYMFDVIEEWVKKNL